MANEEKIKAFFNDKEKVKALENDEEFTNKISGGTATAGAYKDEFKKFGLELSDDEAKLVQKTVAKAMDTPTEKLDDSFLESLASGKVTGTDVAAGIGLGVVGIVLAGIAVELAGIGMSMAGRVYAAKAKHAYKNNDYEKSDKYLEKANKLDRLGSDTMSFGFTKAIRKYEGEEDFYDDFYLRY